MLAAGGGAQPYCARVVCCVRKGLMARIDPEVIKLLGRGRGRSEKLGWL